jgi:glycine/D-amino acid oxidase-like deaminating enzyme
VPASDIVVVGGGVLGLSTAYHLVRAGARVTLVDRADVGRATAAGAGILSGDATTLYEGPRYELVAKSFQYYPVLIDLLADDDAGETDFARCPMLLVAVDEAEEALLAKRRSLIFERQARLGAPAPEDLCEIKPEEARRFFPPLTEVRRAILYRDAGRVDGRLLAQALRRAGERHGLVVRRASVTRLLVERGRAHGVVIDEETLPASAVVVAGGAWSPALADELGVEVPVSPQRGQIAHLRLPGQPTEEWAVISGFRGHYIVTWPEGRVVAGATRETGSGYAPVVTASGVAEVLSEALRVAPGLAAAELQEVRVGLRPLAADDTPVLGRVPGTEDVYLATGHGPHGLQLGPFSGKLVADLILGRPLPMDTESFAVSRFR